MNRADRGRGLSRAPETPQRRPRPARRETNSRLLAICQNACIRSALKAALLAPRWLQENASVTHNAGFSWGPPFKNVRPAVSLLAILVVPDDTRPAKEAIYLFVVVANGRRRRYPSLSRVRHGAVADLRVSAVTMRKQEFTFHILVSARDTAIDEEIRLSDKNPFRILQMLKAQF
ncbi:hypothetical protein EVAR_39940_1 [Eumeta japonica]|uniref:Uncharacterized protein n=1 Tax=Eumeta variegata TaxID=151549 RepID=A0A4C1X0V0_EUMVA|nr:hypothetical protein EVAR_39940_1 [Eumeta japonica]